MPMPMPGMSAAPYLVAAIWVVLLLGVVGLVALAVRYFSDVRRRLRVRGEPAGRPWARPQGASKLGDRVSQDLSSNGGGASAGLPGPREPTSHD